jgi:hypothetical protein
LLRDAVVPPFDQRAMISIVRIRETAMSGDSDSKIAWHRVQLRKNRDALKALETARFTIGDIAGGGRMQYAIASLKRKIAESERCILIYERQTKRPMATDFRSLTSVSWSSWNAHTNGER